EETGRRELAASAKAMLAYARLDTGDFDAVNDLEAVIADRERRNSPEVALTYLNAGSANAELIGDVRRGIEFHQKAAAAAVRFGIGWVRHHADARTAVCLYWLDQWDEALECVEAYLRDRGGGHHRYVEA